MLCRTDCNPNRTPELACEVTLQPLKRFPLDAAIIFCDILVVLQALGLEVKMEEKKGPVLPNPIVAPAECETVANGGRMESPVDITQRLGYVMEAIRRTRLALQGRVPLIGFVGAPFTLMAYAVEGGGSKTYAKVKSFLFRHPEASHKLLQTFTDVCVDFLVEQVHAGVQMAQVFDSWAGELSPAQFAEFSLPYLVQIARRVRIALDAPRTPSAAHAPVQLPYVPLIVFAKGAHFGLEQLSRAGYDVVSLDWTMAPAVARAAVQDRVTLQGNLDPCTLFAPEATLRSEARAMIDAFGTQRYIVNLGHGMLPEHSPDAVAALVDEVHSYSERKIAEEAAAKAAAQ